MRSIFRRRSGDAEAVPELREPESARAAALMEESREIVVLLDPDDRVVASSRRAREAFGALPEGTVFPPPGRPGRGLTEVARVPITVGSETEALVYYNEPGDLAAYEELRAGFTAAVSHELRTPLARLLVLLETASLPGEDSHELIDQARLEVEQIGELIDDVLFLSELETGRQVVSLASTPALPVLEEIAADFEERAARAGVSVRIEGDAATELPLRPRMLRVVAENLTQNAIRYAGPGSAFVLAVASRDAGAVLEASDNGGGVADADLPRLFERFYRADRARASRGTGLGLAIVKHVVTAAGGTVEAVPTPGGGLTIRCSFSRS